MKIIFLIFSCVFILFFSGSCSDDDGDAAIDLLGVWEITTINEDSSDTYRLVFGTNNTGLHILTSEFNSGEVISNATSFDWTQDNKIVIVSRLDNETQDTYIINEAGKLVLSPLEELRLEKVSDDYSQYY